MAKKEGVDLRKMPWLRYLTLPCLLHQIRDSLYLGCKALIAYRTSACFKLTSPLTLLYRKAQTPTLSTIMLYLIGLGLADEKDITVKGLEIVRKAERVYLEAYTSILLVNHEKLVDHPPLLTGKARELIARAQ